MSEEIPDEEKIDAWLDEQIRLRLAGTTDEMAACHDSHGQYGLCHICVRHGRLEGARIVRDAWRRYTLAQFARDQGEELDAYRLSVRHAFATEHIPDDAALGKLIEGGG